jgi:hypothetical protein
MPGRTAGIWAADCGASEAPGRLESCQSYTRGLADGFILSLSFGRSPACIPESATTGELVDAGLNYWKELNPEDRYHVSAHLFLVSAWRKVWPCGSKGNEKQ